MLMRSAETGLAEHDDREDVRRRYLPLLSALAPGRGRLNQEAAADRECIRVATRELDVLLPRQRLPGGRVRYTPVPLWRAARQWPRGRNSVAAGLPGGTGRIALGVGALDLVPGLFGRFDVLEDMHVFGIDHAVLDQHLEIDQPRPELLAEEQDRAAPDLGGLGQRGASNSSSRVPKPPGKLTSATARIRKCILRMAK